MVQMTRRKKMLLAAPAAAALLVTGGLLAGPVNSWAAGGDDPSLSRSEVEQIASEQFPGENAFVTESELDREGGVLVYELDLSNGHDVYIDANTGNVLSTARDWDDDDDDDWDDDRGRDRDDDDDDDRDWDDDRAGTPAAGANETATGAATEPAISRDDAERIALEQHPGQLVTEMSLDHEHGRLVYEVELSNDWDLHIDAQDGSVLRNEPD